MGKEASTISKEKRTELDDLYAQVDRSNVPHHVAIIMDGNGRWANARSISRIQGHREGVRSVDEVVTAALEIGIKVLTLYAFSVENWKRPRKEVDALMFLLKEYILQKIAAMKEKNIRLTAMGRLQDLPPSIRPFLTRATEDTAENHGLILNLALSYGGRTEILDAVKAILQDYSEKKIRLEDVDEERISSYLYTAGLPDPDLMIRTSGEQRISNFLPWQSVYTELYFTATHWPDFRQGEFLKAVLSYQTRERRFGLTGEQVRTFKGKEDAF